MGSTTLFDIGGGGGALFVPVQESPVTGVANGINAAFTTSLAPYSSAALIVTVDGAKNSAWTLASTTVTFTAGNIPATDQIVEFWYLTQLGGGPPASVSGFVSQGTGAAPVVITPAVGVVATTGLLQQQYITGVAAGGAQLVTAVPQISAGTTVGQKMVLKIKGNGVDYPIFQNGVGGLQLNGNWPGSPVAVTEQSLQLDWDGTLWTEDFRR